MYSTICTSAKKTYCEEKNNSDLPVPLPPNFFSGF